MGDASHPPPSRARTAADACEAANPSVDASPEDETSASEAHVAEGADVSDDDAGEPESASEVIASLEEQVRRLTRQLERERARAEFAEKRQSEVASELRDVQTQVEHEKRRVQAAKRKKEEAEAEAADLRQQLEQAGRRLEQARQGDRDRHTSRSAGTSRPRTLAAARICPTCTNPRCIEAGTARGHAFEECGRPGGPMHVARGAQRRVEAPAPASAASSRSHTAGAASAAAAPGSEDESEDGD